MKIIRSVLRGIAASPGKNLLTVFTVGAGVGVLILALSLSSFFSSLVEKQLSSNGTIITFANGTLDANGQVSRARPAQFDENVMDIVQSEVAGVSAISPIDTPPWQTMRIDNRNYQIRSAIGVSGDYFDVMGLTMAIGQPFSDEDIRLANKKAIVTRNLAEQLFGSADAALGKTVQPPSFGPPPDQNQANAPVPSIQTFVIQGVMENPDEVQRRAYGVADIMVPYTAALPEAMRNSSFFSMGFLLATQVIRVEGASLSTVSAQLNEVLTRAYGEDLELLVWEGTPDGESAWLEEARQTIATFNLVINLLGFVLLVTGAIGILSIMLVETLGRSRQIALERSFGASKGRIVGEFFARSAALSLISAFVGLILSLIFASPLKLVLEPVLTGAGLGGAVTNGDLLITLPSILIAFAASVVIGGVFGIFPVMSNLKVPISDGIRDL